MNQHIRVAAATVAFALALATISPADASYRARGTRGGFSDWVYSLLFGGSEDVDGGGFIDPLG